MLGYFLIGENQSDLGNGLNRPNLLDQIKNVMRVGERFWPAVQ